MTFAGPEHKAVKISSELICLLGWPKLRSTRCHFECLCLRLPEAFPEIYGKTPEVSADTVHCDSSDRGLFPARRGQIADENQPIFVSDLGHRQDH